jgi:hypothetical protein
MNANKHTNENSTVSTRSATASRRRGISLMEVLISAFIMAVGLLGVAALLPVGYHEANAGAVADRSAVLGQQAFRDFRIRGIIPPARTDSNSWNEPLILPVGVDQRYRSGDDERYTWMIWACREPYNPTKLKRSWHKDGDGEEVEGYGDTFSDRYIDYSGYENAQDSTDDESLVRVLVFVFHLEDPSVQLFKPDEAEKCPKVNRPVAVFEKLMRLDGQPNGSDPINTTPWGAGLE